MPQNSCFMKYTLENNNFSKFMLAGSIETSETRVDFLIKIKLSYDQTTPINVDSNGPHTKKLAGIHIYLILIYDTLVILSLLAELQTSRQKLEIKHISPKILKKKILRKVG